MNRIEQVAELMRTVYRVPDLAGYRVLLAGLGGGCDIFTAWAIRHVLAGAGAAEFVCSNTTRRGYDDTAQETLSPHVLTSDILRYLAEDPVAAVRPVDSLLFVVPDRADEAGFIDEVRRLRFDFIFGIDAGGDSLTPSALSGPEGRDKTTLRLLRQTGLPLHHVVVGPGCYGEATADALADAILREASLGRYLGCLSLEPLYADFRRIARHLTPDRTPRIILAAAARAAGSDDRTMIVERGLWPLIPVDWLVRGFVFGAT